MKIVKHFANHVITLRFDENEQAMHIADIALLMDSMNNVEEVTFTALKVNGYAKERSKNPTIQMPKLKRIILDDCYDAASVDGVLACVSAKSLEGLYVQGTNVSDYNQFFNDNKTINSIVMATSDEQHNLKALDQLQLSELQIYLDGDSNGNTVRDVVAHQPKLKHLNLLPDQQAPYDHWFDPDDDVKGIVHKDLFNIICNLKDLESLKMAIGQTVTPDAMRKMGALTNLKQIVISASAVEGDFDNDYDYDVGKMRSDVHFQKCFQKLIATPLPKLESFTWSLKNCEWDDEYFMSDDEDLMEAARHKEYSSLGRVNIIATMASSFSFLKCLRIEMKTNDAGDTINVRDALKRFCKLETLHLKTNSTFEGDPIQMHECIKHVKINEIEKHFLIEMLQMMPNLETFVVRNTLFSLDASFLKSLQAVIPQRLKNLELKFHSRKHQDFAMENVVILQTIVKRLVKGKVKLTGNCGFDSLAEKIDRSVGVSLPRSPKWYVPGDDIGYESYMELWK